MAAWRVQCSRPMPWTTQQWGERNWPVQNRSLLCCLGRPRAAKTAFMARSEVALADFCPTLWWVDAMSRMPYFGWAPYCMYCMHWMMAMILTKCLNSQCRYACFTEWPLHQRNWRHFSWTTSSISRSVICWQSGPAIFFFVRARSAVLSRDGTAQSNWMCYQELMTEQGASLDSCNHSRTVHPCFVATTRTFEADQPIRG